jgi:hypothetical protein
MKNETPWCCGQKMNATYRYMEKGVIYRTFVCDNPSCKRREKVEWE